MDNKQLIQLKRQKALILNHLEWLDQEIEKATISHIPELPFSPKESRLAEAFADDKPVAHRLDPESVPSNQVAADLYSELGPDTKSAAAKAKRDLLMLGGIAFTGFAGVVAYVIFAY